MRSFGDKENNYLCDLFHYDLSTKKHGELKKGLEEYKFLLFSASKAIENLQNGEFEKFDSLVGENACQIRAVKIALIVSKNIDNFEDLKQRIKNALEIVNQLLISNSLNKLMHRGKSLKELIKEHDIKITMNADELFMINSFLLCEMKELQLEGDILTSILRLEKCSPYKIQEWYPDISYSFLKGFAKKLRTELSKASVNFVRKTAFELQDPSLMKMVAEEFEVEHNKLLCVPTFWTLKTLFSLLQKKTIPLVVHVKFLNKLEHGYQMIDEDFLYFRPCQITNTYLEFTPKEEDLALPSCVIQGVVCPKDDNSLPSKEEWKITMSKNSLFDVILAVGAHHRQYPNSDLTINVEDNEYEHYKNLAESNGFALTNPSTFFAQHIFCSQLKRQASIQSGTLFI